MLGLSHGDFQGSMTGGMVGGVTMKYELFTTGEHFLINHDYIQIPLI
jgi:hypothetical protein